MSSLISFDEVLEVASRSDTDVYPIGLGQAASGGTRRPDEGQFILRQLAQRTGGRAFFAGSADDLADVYRLIRDELASQYNPRALAGMVNGAPFRCESSAQAWPSEAGRATSRRRSNGPNVLASASGRSVMFTI